MEADRELRVCGCLPTGGEICGGDLDEDCDGASERCIQCGGQECATGAVCVDERCTCPADETICDGRCVSLALDDASSSWPTTNPGIAGATQIELGWDYTLAMAGGELWGWGYAWDGQLMIGGPFAVEAPARAEWQ